MSPLWFHRRSVGVNTALGGSNPHCSVLLSSTATRWPSIWPCWMMKWIHRHVVGHGRTAVAGNGYNWICLVSRIVKHGSHRLCRMVRFSSRCRSSREDLCAIRLRGHLRRHRLPAHGLREISRDRSSVSGWHCLRWFPNRGAAGGNTRNRSFSAVWRVD